MASSRINRIAGSLSEGLGLFAQKSAQDEQERVDREWQLSMERIRASNADARQQAGFKHSENLSAENNRAAQTRADSAATATASFRKDQMSQRDSEFDRKMVADARNNLASNLSRMDEAMQKEQENIFDPEEKAQVAQRYQGLKDNAIMSTVSWLSAQNLPGFEVKDKGSLQSMLTQMGMDPQGAGQAAGALWQQGTGGDLFDAPESSAAIPSQQDRQAQYIDMVNSGQIVDQNSPVSAATPSAAAPSQGAEGLFETTAPPQLGAPSTQQQFPWSPELSVDGSSVGPDTKLFRSFMDSPFFNKNARDKNRKQAEEWRARNQ